MHYYLNLNLNNLNNLKFYFGLLYFKVHDQQVIIKFKAKTNYKKTKNNLILL